MRLNLYSAPWCSSCQTVKKALETLTVEDLDIVVINIDTLTREDLMKVQVRGIPTLILQDSEGNEVKRKSGSLTTQQLKQFLGLDN